MPDHRFFKKTGVYDLGYLAQMGGLSLGPGVEASDVVQDLAPLNRAGAGDLAFFHNVAYGDDLEASQAEFCILDPKYQNLAPKGMKLLFSPTPHTAYAKVANVFYPEDRGTAGVSTQSIIDPTAQLGTDCGIAPGAVIGAHVILGSGVRIGANAVIGDHVEIGEGTRVGANATISHALIGRHCDIYPGVRIGQRGFGFSSETLERVPVPQLGRVIIGNHVDIGANTAIDRGSGPDTIIEDGAMIDNLVQIAHNVHIGKGAIIVAQVGISGSAHIGDFAVLAGQVGVTPNVVVGAGAQIGAQSGVMRDVAPMEKVAGSPAMPARDWKRSIIALAQLSKKSKEK